MNTSRIKSRLRKLEERLSPADDGTFTLEELCRAMWQERKSDFLKLARDTCLGYFVAQFEREDAECDQSRTARRRATGGRR